MADAPNSYKDPFYADLAAKTEAKLGLPDGLLSSIVTKGERSNADQVSSAGAQTVFQIIPATRKAAIDKYGIDPYLSPENAADVAGLLLRDSLKRNNNDPSAAVSEYIGGTNKANWGPQTKAYVGRVMTGMNSAKNNTLNNDFSQFMAQNPAVPAGRSTSAASDQPVVPQTGTQQAASLPDSELNSDFSNFLKYKAGPAANQIPGVEGGNTQITPEQPTSLTDKIIGAGEAGLNAITGMTGGALGTAAGTVSGIANSIGNGTFGTQSGVQSTEQAASDAANALTYQPRTQSGQQQAQVVGDVMNAAVPLMPMAGELGAAAGGIRPALRAAGDQAVSVLNKAATAMPELPGSVTNTLQAVQNRIPGLRQEAPAVIPEQAVQPTPGTMASGGSAGTDIALQRRQLAADLPIPVELTRGQAERSFEQQRFEQESAKNAEAGLPIRERYAQQNQDILKNFDAWIDQTGAEAPSLRAVGQSVDAALVSKAARDKAEIRVAYKNAEKAGEMQEPVTVDPLVKMLNDSTPAESVAPVISATKAELQRLGGAARDADGNLVPQELKLGDAELLRRFVNKVAGADPTNIKFAADIKNAIDTSTAGAGGELYQQARSLRARYANQYENRAVIDKLLSTKRGSSDRSVALEDVWNHAILNGSLDDVRTMRKVLQTGGADGMQAWRELQGQTVNWMKEQATRNSATDIRGNPIVSAAGLNKAIKQLDADGKLDFIFSKRGAQQLRDINDLSKVVFTSPPGSVNHSNTASTILGALTEAGITGSLTGLPVPVITGVKLLTQKLKDRKLAARINDALHGGKRVNNTTQARK